MQPEYINAKAWWEKEFPAATSATDQSKPAGGTFGLVKRYDQHERLSDSPLVLDFVSRQYKDAISYTAHPSGWRGMVVVGALLTSACAVFGASHSFFSLLDWKSLLFNLMDVVFLGAFSAAALVIVIWGFRLEFFRPLEECFVFDRGRRRVYMLIKATEPGIKGLFKRWPLHAYELEWDLIDVEHHATLMTTGVTLRREHALVFCVRRSETDPTVMYTFQIFPSAVLATDEVVDGLWEHLRRYMEEDGPPVPPGAALAPSKQPDSYWQVLCSILPLKRYGKWWREELPVALLVHALLPVSLPFILIWAFFGWLTVKTAIPTTWPKQIADALGPEVSTPPA